MNKRKKSSVEKDIVIERFDKDTISILEKRKPKIVYVKPEAYAGIKGSEEHTIVKQFEDYCRSNLINIQMTR